VGRPLLCLFVSFPSDQGMVSSSDGIDLIPVWSGQGEI
jgi:hypothetical protein